MTKQEMIDLLNSYTGTPEELIAVKYDFITYLTDNSSTSTTSEHIVHYLN